MYKKKTMLKALVMIYQNVFQPQVVFFIHVQRHVYFVYKDETGKTIGHDFIKRFSNPGRYFAYSRVWFESISPPDVKLFRFPK